MEPLLYGQIWLTMMKNGVLKMCSSLYIAVQFTNECHHGKGHGAYMWPARLCEDGEPFVLNLGQFWAFLCKD